MWNVLFDLAALTAGVVVVYVLYFAQHGVPLPDGHWALWLRASYLPMLAVSVAAVIAASAALVRRMWRREALALLVFCASFQAAALAFELHLTVRDYIAAAQAVR